MKKIVEAIVDFSIRRPWIVLAMALCVLLGAWRITQKLELRSDFLELLPRDSPGFVAFEQTLKRMGGGATLYVIVESPNRKANEKMIDDAAAKVEASCGPELVQYVETGTKEVRQFFKSNKWLYADLDDLKKADDTLDHQIAIKSGMVSDLESDDDEDAPKKKKPAAANANAPASPEAKPTLGMDEFHDRWEKQGNKHDDFPTGYFATPDGNMLGFRIVSPTTGTGDRGGDILFAKVQDIVKDLDPSKYDPQMKVGFAGDIPNAIAEKDSIVSEAAYATGLATLLILFGIVAYFRSFSSIAIMLVPAAVGVACAYSFATLAIGYVNTSGAFLGAIILGNGINYPIVLLGRYREFVARGMAPDVAKKAAVWNAFRAELVGASVAGIAYGSLVITRFRGFSQFGMIGFVGMLLVWLSIIPLVPAMVELTERARKVPILADLIAARDSLLDSWPLKFFFPRVDATGARGPLVKAVAVATARWPWAFLFVAAVLTIAAAVKLPAYLRDPWEYNFAHLGSKGSKHGGAGEWSSKSEKVFGGKMNVAGARMLADRPEQTALVKAKILANDKADPEGQLVAEVSTVDDLLPGTVEEQKKKLVILDQIRDRLTEGVLAKVSEEEKKKLLEMRPPETLKPIVAKELPGLLRRPFEEKDGTVGTVFYVKYGDISLSDGHNLLRIAKTTDNVKLPDDTVVNTASRSTIFAEMIRSMERDGPLATFASLAAVAVVVVLATSSARGAVCVLASLVMGVILMIGGAAWSDMKLNFLNFIALPITFGIGCEYPFNIFDRSRLLGGDVATAVRRSGGAVALCSYTTIVGYGSLLFADNQALESFGRLAMSGELTCIACALLVLPSLLHVWKQKAGTVAVEHANANPPG
ncbi:MAG TPA: MMPL family transporter [Labilithrix sp.]